MSRAKLTFRQMVHNIQDYEWNEAEHIISRVYFDYEVDGMTNTGLFADIMQPAGVPEDSAPLAVKRPSNYGGLFAFDAFSDAARQYYRDLCKDVTPTELRRQNLKIAKPRIIEVELKSGMAGG